MASLPRRQHRPHSNLIAAGVADRLTKASVWVIKANAKFIPEGQLHAILTREFIENCIQESEIEPDLWDDCIRAVLLGGRRILAILVLIERVHLLGNFIEIDGSHQDLPLDSRLPLPLNRLIGLLESDSKADDFYRRQWEVLAPVFDGRSIHRKYEKNTVIPFTRPTKQLGRGAFGDVFMVTLPNSQHRFQGLQTKQDAVCVVCKTLIIDNQFSSSGEREEEFRNEQRILTLLRNLRHPNIIQLLASFTIEAEDDVEEPIHNFIFPLAEYSLSKILNEKSKDIWSSQFPSDYAIFRQFYGLLSAIDSFHNFVLEDKIELEYIGCHCDLNPRNILVNNGTLLLADFGLSRFHEDNSKAKFKKGQGDYLAPECEPITDGNFTKGIISRPSDIWSLACVILEAFSYHEDGFEAVQEFRTLRRDLGTSRQISDTEYTSSKFHCAEKLNVGVTQWLGKLEENKPSRVGLIQQIKSMLEINPLLRPVAKEVTVFMFRTAGEFICERICTAFESLASSPSFLAIKTEQQRFLLWASAAKLLCRIHSDPKFTVQAKEYDDWLLKFYSRFAEICDLLSLIQDELRMLQDVLGGDEHITWAFYLKLEDLIDKLWDFLPPPLLEKLTAKLEASMIDSEDHKLLNLTWRALGGRTSYHQIARLAALKFITTEFQGDNRRHQQGKAKFFDKEIASRREREPHSFGTLPKSDDREAITVLIEYMSYTHSREPDHFNQLEQRAQSLARLQSGQNPNGTEGDLPDGFRILKCVGYFHARSKLSFGLMYEFPKGFPQDARPVTLKELIRGVQRPDLGALFKLAYAIVTCVFNFHEMKWVHKNISAQNVLFFDSQMTTLILPSTTQSVKQRSMSPAPVKKADEIPPDQPIVEKKRSFIHHLVPSKKAGKKTNTSPLPLPLSATTSRSSLSNYQLDIPEQLPSLEATNKLDSPYLVGFSHSREDEKDALTIRAPTLPQQAIYQHPEYQAGQANGRFHLNYDNYSTGLVLLEIGMWQTLEELAPGMSREEARSAWLSVSVPLLGSLMGKTYQDAVRACLEGRSVSKEEFDGAIVKKLEKCYA